MMQNISIKKFEKVTDLGIHLVPQGSLVFIEDAGGYNPLILMTLNTNGLSPTTTIQEFLTMPDRYKIIVNSGSMDFGVLTKVIENEKTGYALRYEDRNNHGNIGYQAYDFSISSIPKSQNPMGAMGDYSVVFGKNVYTVNTYGVVFGKYNIDKDGLAFMIGNGDNDTNRRNAFEIYDWGIIVAPDESIQDIDDAPPRVLITKEYLTNSEYIIDGGFFNAGEF